MPSNKENEAPYFQATKQRKDSDGKGQMPPKSGPSCIIAISGNGPIFTPAQCNRCRIAAVVVQFAKLLDLASNTEIAEFGETRGMRYRNWIVSDALRNKLIKSIQLIVKDIFAQNSI